MASQSVSRSCRWDYPAEGKQVMEEATAGGVSGLGTPDLLGGVTLELRHSQERWGTRPQTGGRMAWSCSLHNTRSTLMVPSGGSYMGPCSTASCPPGRGTQTTPIPQWASGDPKPPHPAMGNSQNSLYGEDPAPFSRPTT